VVTAEADSLVSYLDQQRESVLDIVDGLPEAALRRAVFPSGWTCLGLIHHLAIDDERYWFRGVAAGEPIEFPACQDPGWVVGPQITAEQALSLYREETARANAIIAATPLDAPARRRDPRWDAWGWPEPEQTVNLRWIILHMIEETARHAGHLDTARELIDGRTGLGVLTGKLPRQPREYPPIGSASRVARAGRIAAPNDLCGATRPVTWSAGFPRGRGRWFGRS
jgi:hypothetical protein